MDKQKVAKATHESSAVGGNADDARPIFSVTRFNPRRAARGAAAVEVQVTWPDRVIDYVWMSKQDIKGNMAVWGECDGLNDAMSKYKAEGRDDG